jgi:PAS domain S-box-containing protein
MNYISDGVYFVDLERKITYWNEAASKITGYSANEVMNRACFDDRLSHISDDGTHLCGELSFPIINAKRGYTKQPGLFFA